jgi:glycosyltransferase involved in cell wall biosynthesis
MARLSIVIPTLNEEHDLPNLFQSLRQQSCQDFEIIVADAGSKDRTREVARAAGAKVVEGGLPGPGRNSGAKHATGELLLFLDADVVLPDVKFLERVMGEFEKRKLDIGTTFLKPLTKNILDKALYALYDVYTFVVQKFVPHAPGFFILVRRTIHEKIGGFNEVLDFAEDHEYTIRAAKIGKFGFLRSGRIPVSVRRFDRDGRRKVARQYVKGEWHLITKGYVPPGSTDYGFGYNNKKE